MEHIMSNFDSTAQVIVLFALYIIANSLGFLKPKEKEQYKRGCIFHEENKETLKRIERGIVACKEFMEEKEKDFYEAKKEVKDLWDWHNITDGDGTKIWYVKKSLEDAIVSLSKNIEKQTELLRDMVKIIERTDNDVKALKKDGK